MRRFVKEFANAVKADLYESMQFAKMVACHYKQGEKEQDEIHEQYTDRMIKVDKVVQQCEYGYISEIEAVRQIAKI